jgi:predicted lipopolysaccharide heptosyltransferase III
LNSLREIVESSPQLRGLAMQGIRGENSPQPLAPAGWDWSKVERVLVVRLRSIGDTVLSTPSLFALKRFLPNASVDILLEDWVAPVLDGFAHVDDLLTISRSSASSRARIAARLRSNRYDVVYNLHGGTTATLLTRATGAKHRVGYQDYQYARLHNHLSPSSSSLWGREKTHSVEQQLALLGWTGVPVTDRPPTQLAVTETAAASISVRLGEAHLEGQPFAVIHPAAAFDTKQWATENFGRVISELAAKQLPTIVITGPNETALVDQLQSMSATPLTAFTNLSLPEVTALITRARLFVGNDSGIAHIAAAVETPSVVIFGSSNRAHWGPWATKPAEMVFDELDCQPCHGYYCEKFDQPECIKGVAVERVIAAIERVLG